jgi:hypothetical protein
LEGHGGLREALQFTMPMRDRLTNG